MYWVLDHGPMNIWCEFGEDPLKKLKGVGHEKRKFGPTRGQKWNCRVWKSVIIWALFVGLYGANLKKIS